MSILVFFLCVLRVSQCARPHSEFLGQLRLREESTCEVPEDLKELVSLAGAGDVNLCDLEDLFSKMPGGLQKSVEKFKKGLKNFKKDIGKVGASILMDLVKDAAKSDAAQELQAEILEAMGGVLVGLTECVLSGFPLTAPFFMIGKKVMQRMSGRGEPGEGFGPKQLAQIRDIVSSVVDSALQEFGSDLMGQQLAGFSAKLNEISGLLEAADNETLSSSNDTTSMEALLTTDSILFVGADVLARLEEFLHQKIQKQDGDGSACKWPPSKQCKQVVNFLQQYADLYIPVHGAKLHAAMLAGGAKLHVLQNFFHQSMKRQKETAAKLFSFLDIDELRAHPTRWHLHWVLYFSGKPSGNSFIPRQGRVHGSDSMASFCELTSCPGLAAVPAVNQSYLLFNVHHRKIIGWKHVFGEKYHSGDGTTTILDDLTYDRATNPAYHWDLRESNESVSDDVSARLFQFVNVKTLKEAEVPVQQGNGSTKTNGKPKVLGTRKRKAAGIMQRFADALEENAFNERSEFLWRLIPYFHKTLDCYLIFNEKVRGTLYTRQDAKLTRADTSRFVKVNNELEIHKDRHQWLLVPTKNITEQTVSELLGHPEEKKSGWSLWPKKKKKDEPGTPQPKKKGWGWWG